MQRIDFFNTIEKLYLIARSLDELLAENYGTLIHDTGVARDRLLNLTQAGVIEMRRGLEALALADPKDFDET